MSFTGWVYLICGLIALIGIVFAARSSFRNTQPRSRGTTPSQNATLVASSYGSGKGDYGSATTIPRDPQAYAKTMQPKK